MLTFSFMLIGSSISVFASEEYPDTKENSQVVESKENEIDENEIDENEEDIEQFNIEEEEFIEIKESEMSLSSMNTRSLSVNEKTYTNKDLKLLACLIFTEAGNQSYQGKLAVANVVLNRLGSPKMSHLKSIEDVIYDNKWGVQFSVTIGGSNSMMAKELRNFDLYKTDALRKECLKAARAALNGESAVGDSLYFCRYSKSKANSVGSYKVIGDHMFY